MGDWVDDLQNSEFAKAIRETCEEKEDVPAEREGQGWNGKIQGFCPVQGYGVVDGLNWYFRARHSGWSFEAWREPFGEQGALPSADPLWWCQEDYGEGDYDASWMPLSDAWGYVEASIKAGRAAEWAMPPEGAP